MKWKKRDKKRKKTSRDERENDQKKAPTTPGKPGIATLILPGAGTDNPEDLLRELVFATALDGYSIDLQSLGFKEGSKVEGMNIHINNSLDLESKIVELVNVLSSINLEHYTKRKDVNDVTRNLEVKMVSAIVCSILGTTVNAAINIDDLRDKSITAIFKAADLVAKSIGVKLKQEEVC